MHRPVPTPRSGSLDSTPPSTNESSTGVRPLRATPAFTRRRLFRGVGGLGLGAVAASGGVGGAAASASSSPARLTAWQSGNAGTLTIATNRVPTDLDPHTAYDLGSIVAQKGPYETLITVEPGTADRFDPLIARSWTANDDMSVWTFLLHEGVTFHDGTPCDAAAVRASFERLLAIDRAPSSVIGRFVQDAAQITTPDATTVVFDLGRPQPLFEAALATANGASIVNAGLARQHEVDGDWGNSWAITTTDGLGTGPYRIVESDPLARTVLERHAAYWRGWDPPYTERVVMRIVPEAETRRELIETGDADIVENISPEALNALVANPDLLVDLRYNLTVVYIILNGTGPLEDPRARQAICHAFPYDEVVNGVYEGYAKRAVGPCAELCHGFDPETYSYQTDLERARSLLDEAGVSAGTTLTMFVPSGSPWVGSAAELLRANLEQLGLALETQPVDYPTLISIYYGDMPAEERPHLMPAAWSPDYNDGWNHLWPQVSSEAWSGGNAGHYANPEVDALLAQARDAVDETTYQAALSKVQQIVTRDDPAAIYALQPQWPTVLRNDIEGFVPNLVATGLYDFYRVHRRP